MIVVVRHGLADKNYNGDFYRDLTEQGSADIAKRAEYFKKIGITFDATFVSPYVRTLQTLDVIKNYVSVGDVTITKELEPNANPTIVDYLRVLSDSGMNILVISHMPLVSFIIRELGGNFVNGFMNPGDMVVFGEKGTNEIFKVIYATNAMEYIL